MVKNIHQKFILKIDTDQMKVKNIDPNYWNCLSGEKYWLNCLSDKHIEWIIVAEKDVDQMKECQT